MESSQCVKSRWTVLPVVFGEDCGDLVALLVNLWDEMVREGREKILFYDGGVKTAEEWVRFLALPSNLPVVVLDTQERRAVCVVWLNHIGQGQARVHFGFVGPFQRGAGRAALAYWDSFRDDHGEPLFHVLVGVTPESNDLAVRVTKVLGFTQAGRIPRLCQMADKSRVAGVLTYRLREG